MSATQDARPDGPVAHAQSLTYVTGLSEPVEILRDRWGIAHIYAANENDLFFAQGYSAARDRLFQLELWRLQATGTSAEVLGRGELKRDIGARLHRFRGDLAQELGSYHPRGEAIVSSFVGGINAYIDETRRDPSLLPIEFRLLSIKPQHWTAAVVASRHQGLVDNVEQEVDLAAAVHKLGVDKIKKLIYFQGGDPALSPDRALDLAKIPPNVLELYQAFRAPLTFTPQQILAADRNESESYRRLASAQVTARRTLLERKQDIGSNNWVVHGSRTQSGFPLLANDPHRVQGAPSLRYWVHLVAPGWNVIGAGEPALPGISIGHNEHGAWGLTYFGSDNEDLYVYDVKPGSPNEYRYRGAWEKMRIVQDTIRIKDEPPVEVTYKYTRHGPVLFEDGSNRKAYALRAAWLDVGGAPYLASLRMAQAQSWEEFRKACAYNHIPSENMIWADRKGNIGYQAAGIQPLRKNWSGLLPVPGDGRYEWDGYLPIEELPHSYNPANGFVATANQFLMPLDYPRMDAMHYTWADPYRAARITEVLASGRLFSVGEMARLQNDDLSIPARTLVPLLAGLPLNEGPASRLRDLLSSWDFVLKQDSAAAAIYEMWQRNLLANVREVFVPKTVVFPPLSLKRMIDHLLAPGAWRRVRRRSYRRPGRDLTTQLRRCSSRTQSPVRQRHRQLALWRYQVPSRIDPSSAVRVRERNAALDAQRGAGAA